MVIIIINSCRTVFLVLILTSAYFRVVVISVALSLVSYAKCKDC